MEYTVAVDRPEILEKRVIESIVAQGAADLRQQLCEELCAQNGHRYERIGDDERCGVCADLRSVVQVG